MSKGKWDVRNRLSADRHKLSLSINRTIFFILDIIYSHRIYLFNVSGCSGPRRGGVTRTVTDHRM